MAVAGLGERSGSCGGCFGLGGLADGGIGHGGLSHCCRGCPGCRARGLHRRSSRLSRARLCSGLSGGSPAITRHISRVGLPRQDSGALGLDRHTRCHGPVGIHRAACAKGPAHRRHKARGRKRPAQAGDAAVVARRIQPGRIDGKLPGRATASSPAQQAHTIGAHAPEPAPAATTVFCRPTIGL